ncbi:DNA polymerase III subunit epsilon [Bathymodiolus platifrons methanotrophic gill symbiont]|uniref:DNA polymerase III subunit epsilon n=1 Tax=Bathymodiolus platifrons methanotrophic gill symbiont TaxID=113268 RepID=UPI000B41F788|nr:DNA polymerase III subunit epsilon [Bathymodiolus platifrons methanotrophic gill symbiont]GAW85236.1 DNA polymerase III subunit epsilon [Bathymodiolus platifrons methanotrophic gill symbiont]GFO74734.1 DNA polymerase III subunit epsilon [Bathymodiolus platifrons methanotrophic gill symbiont]
MRKKGRQVVLDTETTGLNPKEGHRIIEIGCVELVSRRLTDRQFHMYINPERVVDEGAIEVHGITNEFLQDKPLFKEVVDDFLDFIRGAELVIHNAPFDVGFIDNEFSLVNSNVKQISDICTVFDSLVYARKKHPGQRNSLDALCKRYGIDNSHRDLHGALLDSEILSDVYLLMTGGQLSMLEEDDASGAGQEQVIQRLSSDRLPLTVIQCSDDELVEHQKTLAMLEKSSGACLWNQ